MATLKKTIAAVLAAILLLGCFSGCANSTTDSVVIAATTWPVYQFASAVCKGSELSVQQVVGGKISCLHDYTLTVAQMEIIEKADIVLLSGCDLEAFMADALAGCNTVVECSDGITFLENDEGLDPHIWMDPDNAVIMVNNIADEMSLLYPAQESLFRANAEAYCKDLSALKQYGDETLKDLGCRSLITFHNGFAYFAQAFDLTILASIEEEDGATASAETLEHIIALVKDNSIPAIFTEVNGSTSAASVIAAETGVAVFTLSTCMSGDDYLTVMRQNVDTVREALG